MQTTMFPRSSNFAVSTPQDQTRLEILLRRTLELQHQVLRNLDDDHYAFLASHRSTGGDFKKDKMFARFVGASSSRSGISDKSVLNKKIELMSLYRACKKASQSMNCYGREVFERNCEYIQFVSTRRQSQIKQAGLQIALDTFSQRQNKKSIRQPSHSNKKIRKTRKKNKSFSPPPDEGQECRSKESWSYSQELIVDATKEDLIGFSDSPRSQSYGFVQGSSQSQIFNLNEPDDLLTLGNLEMWLPHEEEYSEMEESGRLEPWEVRKFTL